MSLDWVFGTSNLSREIELHLVVVDASKFSFLIWNVLLYSIPLTWICMINSLLPLPHIDQAVTDPISTKNWFHVCFHMSLHSHYIMIQIWIIIWIKLGVMLLKSTDFCCCHMLVSCAHVPSPILKWLSIVFKFCVVILNLLASFRLHSKLRNHVHFTTDCRSNLLFNSFTIILDSST